ncbi:MAG: glycosyltransferase family 2 protein [Patescibacteria group bacterium]|nr:glycosyltransferase family 2 protein [Patescibacteria group bacterium]
MFSIIIANYNGGRYLQDCLDSVLNSNYASYELIVVDDASTDDSVSIIRNYINQNKDKKIRLIKNKKNLGAAQSRNVAIQKAKGDVIVFLDNDTQVDPFWLVGLEEALKDPEVGAAQSLLIDYENRNLIQMAGGKLIPHTHWILPLHHKDSYKKVRKVLDFYEIIAISAALAVKKEAIEIVEVFDEKEAVTTEDIDFSMKIWISGYRVVLAKNSIVYHYTKKPLERSYIKKIENIYFHLAKNSFRSIIKNYELVYVFKYLPFSLAINLGRGFAFLIFRKDLSALKGSLKAIIWNIRNFADTLDERKHINGFRKKNWSYIYKHAMTSESLINIYLNYFRN